MGKGTGNLYIKSFTHNLESTCTIRDVFYYNSLTADKNSYSTHSKVTVTYSSDGMKILGTGGDAYIQNTDITLPTNYSAEMTITGMSSPTGYVTDICFEDLFFQSGENGMARRISASTSNIASNYGRFAVGDVIKVVRDGNAKTIKLYYNDVLKCTFNNINTTGKQQFKTYNGRYTTVKDLIIEQL